MKMRSLKKLERAPSVKGDEFSCQSRRRIQKSFFINHDALIFSSFLCVLCKTDKLNFSAHRKLVIFPLEARRVRKKKKSLKISSTEREAHKIFIEEDISDLVCRVSVRAACRS